MAARKPKVLKPSTPEQIAARLAAYTAEMSPEERVAFGAPIWMSYSYRDAVEYPWSETNRFALGDMGRDAWGLVENVAVGAGSCTVQDVLDTSRYIVGYADGTDRDVTGILMCAGLRDRAARHFLDMEELPAGAREGYVQASIDLTGTENAFPVCTELDLGEDEDDVPATPVTETPATTTATVIAFPAPVASAREPVPTPEPAAMVRAAVPPIPSDLEALMAEVATPSVDAILTEAEVMLADVRRLREAGDTAGAAQAATEAAALFERVAELLLAEGTDPVPPTDPNGGGERDRDLDERDVSAFETAPRPPAMRPWSLRQEGPLDLLACAGAKVVAGRALIAEGLPEHAARAFRAAADALRKEACGISVYENGDVELPF